MVLHLPLAARVFVSRRGRLDRSSMTKAPPGRAARGRCCTIPFVARLAKTTGSEGPRTFILCGWHCVVAITLSPEGLVRK